MIRYARALGADALHMEFVQLFPCANPKNGAVDREALYCYSGPGFGMIYVNKDGKRFVNELTGRDEVSQAQTLYQEKPTYSVFHREIGNALQMTERESESGINAGKVVAADTLAELAEKLNMPAGSLEETVARHNEAIENGADPDFHKPMDGKMIPMRKGPFYGIGQWPSIHFCMGGLRIDTRARVIDIWGEPIPRLYAAGEVCGGVHGANRLGGNAITECIVYGRIAGENAAAEAAV
jgi:fumarate reductase flavoprotein subunit